MAPRFQSHGLLDVRSPIEPGFSVNKGLLNSWAISPMSGWRGSGVMRDLIRGWRIPYDGLFQNAPTWGQFNHRGGYGSIRLANAGTQSVKLYQFNVNNPTATGPMTFACWFWADPSQAGNNYLVGDQLNNFSLNFRADSNNQRIDLQWNGGNVAGAGLTGSQSLYGAWYHILVTRTGSSGNWTTVSYINGGTLSVNTTTGITSNPTLPGGSVTYLGQRGDNASYWFGFIDGAEYWNRGLSAQEALIVYEEGLRGNLNRWRWVSTRAFFVGSSPSPPTILFQPTDPEQEAFFFLSGQTSGNNSYTLNVTDAPTTAESMGRVLVAGRPVVDAPQTTEAAARVLAALRAIADAPATAELAARVLVANRATTDHPQTAETPTSVVGTSVATTDAPTTAEGVGRTLVALRSTTDQPQTAESLTSVVEISRSVTDAPTTAEAVVRLLTALRSVSDTPATVEAVTRPGAFFRTTTDVPTTAELVVRQMGFARATVDHPATAEAVTRLGVFSRSVTDVPTTAEITTGINGKVIFTTDAPITAESSRRTLVASRGGGDTPTSGESLSRALMAGRAVIDSPHASEVPARALTSARIVTDTPTTAESVARQLAASRTINDAPAIVESVSRGLGCFRLVVDAPHCAEVVTAIVPSTVDVFGTPIFPGQGTYLSGVAGNSVYLPGVSGRGVCQPGLEQEGET